jgi:hypothetical protein
MYVVTATRDERNLTIALTVVIAAAAAPAAHDDGVDP